MTVRIGQSAPDFNADAWVRGADGPTRVTLADFRDAYLVLFFYSRDFGDMCPGEIAAFARAHQDFVDLDANILGASTDSYLAHKAWFASEPRLQKVRFPVLADSSHAVSEAYGTLMPDGAATRGTFIIDPDGILLHAEVNMPVVGRSVDETLRVMRALRTGVPRGAAANTGEPAAPAEYNAWLAKALPRLPEQVLVEATAKLRPFNFPAGERVFAEGDRPDRFYIIANGEAEVTRKSADGKEHIVAILGPGEFFGEMGLVTETRRMATVRAKTDLEALALPWDYFVEIIESNEAAAEAFATKVRARATN